MSNAMHKYENVMESTTDRHITYTNLLIQILMGINILHEFKVTDQKSCPKPGSEFAYAGLRLAKLVKLSRLASPGQADQARPGWPA